MNNAPDPEEDILLNTALAGDDWHTLNAGLKHRTLRAFRRRRLLRTSVRATLASAALIAFIGYAWRVQHPPMPPLTAALPQAPAPVQPAPGIPQLTDAQMLALFPKGSCAIAEIDGQKRLIFFDQKQADQGFLVKSQ